MLTPSELSLWLRVAATDHTTAMSELIASTDLKVITEGDTFTVIRAHDNSISRYEIGRAPILPNCSA